MVVQIISGKQENGNSFCVYRKRSTTPAHLIHQPHHYFTPNGCGVWSLGVRGSGLKEFVNHSTLGLRVIKKKKVGVQGLIFREKRFGRQPYVATTPIHLG